MLNTNIINNAIETHDIQVINAEYESWIYVDINTELHIYENELFIH